MLKHQSQVKIIAQDYASETTESGVGQYLPSVSSEIKSVLHILKGRRIPSDYSKDEILKEIENGDLLHFALHSSASDEIHPSAYMVINNESDTILNNLLFDYEIDPLQISASLVVLNACESGSGKLYHGEGMLSISRSFILAGAKSVTQTLWPVDDKASLQVITAFYRGIARGWDKSRSLREAKLKYLDETSPSFSHPYYWAGFQIVGDNSPVVIRKTKYALGAAVVLLITLFFAFRIRFRYKGRRNISI